MTWSKLENKINRPCTKPIEYRETHHTVFADNKLWFFGLRGVDSTTGDSMGWRETSLLGSFVSIYDLKEKKWDFKVFDKIDDNEKHLECIFAVSNKIFMLIYSTSTCCNKLLTWDHDKWNEVKLECAADVGKVTPTYSHDIKVIAVPDGVYILRNGGTSAEIDKLEISVQNGSVKHAKCIHVTNVDLNSLGQQSYLSTVATTKDKMVVWYCQNMCGYWWQPTKPLYGEVKSGTCTLSPITVPDPPPPYAYSGPSHVVNYNNNGVMLGGSTSCGMGKTDDNKEVWVFDINSKTFRKSNLSLVENVPNFRMSYAFDFSTGNLYACDLETGIYVTNLNNV